MYLFFSISLSLLLSPFYTLSLLHVCVTPLFLLLSYFLFLSIFKTFVFFFFPRFHTLSVLYLYFFLSTVSLILPFSFITLSLWTSPPFIPLSTFVSLLPPFFQPLFHLLLFVYPPSTFFPLSVCS
jgi:hypothetical protein